MSKIDKVGYHNKETGELLEKDVYESILKDEKYKTRMAINKKFKNDPMSLTLDEIKLLRLWKTGRAKTKVNLKLEKGTFFMSGKLNEDQEKSLSLDTLGVLYMVSNRMNKYGVINYSNNKPISSFEKLRVHLNIGNTKWARVKKEIDEFKVVIKIPTRENRSVLVVNPLYSLISTEVGELRFLAYGDVLKDILSIEDYIYLCKLYDIVPEYN